MVVPVVCVLVGLIGISPAVATPGAQRVVGHVQTVSAAPIVAPDPCADVRALVSGRAEPARTDAVPSRCRATGDERPIVGAACVATSVHAGTNGGGCARRPRGVSGDRGVGARSPHPSRGVRVLVLGRRSSRKELQVRRRRSSLGALHASTVARRARCSRGACVTRQRHRYGREERVTRLYGRLRSPEVTAIDEETTPAGGVKTPGGDRMERKAGDSVDRGLHRAPDR